MRMKEDERERENENERRRRTNCTYTMYSYVLDWWSILCIRPIFFIFFQMSVYLGVINRDAPRQSCPLSFLQLLSSSKITMRCNFWSTFIVYFSFFCYCYYALIHWYKELIWIMMRKWKRLTRQWMSSYVHSNWIERNDIVAFFNTIQPNIKLVDVLNKERLRKKKCFFFLFIKSYYWIALEEDIVRINHMIGIVSVAEIDHVDENVSVL